MKSLIKRQLLEPLLAKTTLLSHLMFWARWVRRIRHPVIVGITGSVGKSTTTTMIAHVLSQPACQAQFGEVRSTVNNMNDEMGISANLLLYDNFDFPYAYSRRLALLATLPWRALGCLIRPYPKTFVIEYGAGMEAFIAKQAEIAPPDVAVVTTVGAAHLGRMGTIEGVVSEKGALIEAVSPRGVAFVGDAHAHVSALIQRGRCKVHPINGEGVGLAAELTRAVCAHLQVPAKVIDAALATVRPLEGRLNVHEFDYFTLIDDSWNANPLSMRLGLDTLSKCARAGGRRVAVLGWMAELGDDAPALHADIGAYARERLDLLVGIGELGQHYDPDLWFESSDAAIAALTSLLRADDCVLVKGSHSAGTYKVAHTLKAFGQSIAAQDLRATAR